MRRLVLLGLLGLAGSCDPVFCTAIGCFNGVSVALRPETGRWAEGTYELTIDEGREQHHCSLQLPADLPERGSVTSPECGMSLVLALEQNADCTETRSNDAISQSCRPIDGLYTLQAQIQSTPETLTVMLTRDGETVVDEQLEPVYRMSFPNGPECGACKQASVELTW